MKRKVFPNTYNIPFFSMIPRNERVLDGFEKNGFKWLTSRPSLRIEMASLWLFKPEEVPCCKKEAICEFSFFLRANKFLRKRKRELSCFSIEPGPDLSVFRSTSTVRWGFIVSPSLSPDGHLYTFTLLPFSWLRIQRVYHSALSS